MQGLRTAIYLVPDVAAATGWYKKAFEAEPYFESEHYVGFNIGGFELGLHHGNGHSEEKKPSVIAYWGVESVEEQFKRLIETGATPVEPPTNVGGELVIATVMDPWGNSVGLIYNPDFKVA